MRRSTRDRESGQFDTFSNACEAVVGSARHAYHAMLLPNSHATTQADDDEQEKARGQSPLLQQLEYLRVRTILIPRAGDLATRADVFAGSA